MKLLVGIDSYFESYGGPWTAISQKLEYLNKANIDFKLINSSIKCVHISNYFCLFPTNSQALCKKVLNEVVSKSLSNVDLSSKTSPDTQINGIFKLFLYHFFYYVCYSKSFYIK